MGKKAKRLLPRLLLGAGMAVTAGAAANTVRFNNDSIEIAHEQAQTMAKFIGKHMYETGHKIHKRGGDLSMTSPDEASKVGKVVWHVTSRTGDSEVYLESKPNSKGGINFSEVDKLSIFYEGSSISLTETEGDFEVTGTAINNQGETLAPAHPQEVATFSRVATLLLNKIDDRPLRNRIPGN